jgi:hypothetical protein
MNRFLIRFSDSDFQYFDYSAKGTVGIRVPSAFLQDAWRLMDRLRLNAGVRWAGEVHHLLGGRSPDDPG